MSVCPQCGEMTSGISCRPDPISIGGQDFEPIRWGAERGGRARVIDFKCRDCNTPPGGVHHPGCSVERCPACLGQALRCPCFGYHDVEDEVDDNSRPVGTDRLRRRVRSRARCRAHLFLRHH